MRKVQPIAIRQRSRTIPPAETTRTIGVPEIRLEDISDAYRQYLPGTLASYSIAEILSRTTEIETQTTPKISIRNVPLPPTEPPFTLTKRGLHQLLLGSSIELPQLDRAIETLATPNSDETDFNQALQQIAIATSQRELPMSTKSMGPIPTTQGDIDTTPTHLDSETIANMSNLTEAEQALARAEATKTTLNTLKRISQNANSLAFESRGTPQAQQLMALSESSADAFARIAVAATIDLIRTAAEEANPETKRTLLRTASEIAATITTEPPRQLETTQSQYIPTTQPDETTRSRTYLANEIGEIKTMIDSGLRIRNVNYDEMISNLKSHIQNALNRRNRSALYMAAVGNPIFVSATGQANVPRRTMLEIIPRYIANKIYARTLKEAAQRIAERKHQQQQQSAISFPEIVSPSPKVSTTTVLIGIGPEMDVNIPYPGRFLSDLSGIFSSIYGTSREETDISYRHEIDIHTHPPTEQPVLLRRLKRTTENILLLSSIQPPIEMYPIGIEEGPLHTTRVVIETDPESNQPKFTIQIVQQPTLTKKELQQIRRFISERSQDLVNSRIPQTQVHILSTFVGFPTRDRTPHLIVSFYSSEKLKVGASLSEEDKRGRTRTPEGETTREKRIILTPTTIAIPIGELENTSIPQKMEQAVTGIGDPITIAEGTATGQDSDLLNFIELIASNLIKMQIRYNVYALDFIEKVLQEKTELREKLIEKARQVLQTQSVVHEAKVEGIPTEQYKSHLRATNVTPELRAAAVELARKSNLSPYEKERVIHAIQTALVLPGRISDQEKSAQILVSAGDTYAPIVVKDNPLLYDKLRRAYAKQIPDAQRVAVSAEITATPQAQEDQSTQTRRGRSRRGKAAEKYSTIAGGYYDNMITGAESFPPLVFVPTQPATAPTPEIATPTEPALPSPQTAPQKTAQDLISEIDAAIDKIVQKTNERKRITRNDFSAFEQVAAHIQSLKPIQAQAVKTYIENKVEFSELDDKTKSKILEIFRKPAAAPERAPTERREDIIAAPPGGSQQADITEAQPSILQQTIHLVVEEPDSETYTVNPLTINALREQLASTGRQVVYIAGPRNPRTDNDTTKQAIYRYARKMGVQVIKEGNILMIGAAEGVDLAALQGALEELEGIPDDSQKVGRIVLVLPIQTANDNQVKTVIEFHISHRVNQHNNMRWIPEKDPDLVNKILEGISNGTIQIVTLPGERSKPTLLRDLATQRDEYMVNLSDKAVFITPEASTSGGTQRAKNYADRLKSSRAELEIQSVTVDDIKQPFPAETSNPTLGHIKWYLTYEELTQKLQAQKQTGGNREDLLLKIPQIALISVWSSFPAKPYSTFQQGNNIRMATIGRTPTGEKIQTTQVILTREKISSTGIVEKSPAGRIVFPPKTRNIQDGFEHIQMYAPLSTQNIALRDLWSSVAQRENPATIAVVGSPYGPLAETIRDQDGKEHRLPASFVTAKQVGEIIALSNRTLVIPLIQGHALAALWGALTRNGKVVIISPAPISENGYYRNIPKPIIDLIQSKFVSGTFRALIRPPEGSTEAQRNQDVERKVANLRSELIEHLAQAVEEGRVVFVSVTHPGTDYVLILQNAEAERESRSQDYTSRNLEDLLRHSALMLTGAFVGTGTIIGFGGESAKPSKQEDQQQSTQQQSTQQRSARQQSTSTEFLTAGDVAIIAALAAQKGFQEYVDKMARVNKAPSEKPILVLERGPREEPSPEKTLLEEVIRQNTTLEEIYNSSVIALESDLPSTLRERLGVQEEEPTRETRERPNRGQTRRQNDIPADVIANII
jgi:hypothetical protein